jgi:hypothetical protein
MDYHGIHAASTRAAAECGAQSIQIRRWTSRDHFYVSVFGVAHPAVKAQRARFTVHKPAEADALDTSFDEIVSDHGIEASVAEESHRRKSRQEGPGTAPE